MIRRTARQFGSDPAKPALGKLKLVDKDIDRPNRIVLANPVFQAFRKDRGLFAIRAFNEASHLIPRKSRRIISRESRQSNEIEGFHTAWLLSRPNLPCALKAAIGIRKQTLGHP